MARESLGETQYMCTRHTAYTHTARTVSHWLGAVSPDIPITRTASTYTSSHSSMSSSSSRTADIRDPPPWLLPAAVTPAALLTPAAPGTSCHSSSSSPKSGSCSSSSSSHSNSSGSSTRLEAIGLIPFDSWQPSLPAREQCQPAAMPHTAPHLLEPWVRLEAGFSHDPLQLDPGVSLQATRLALDGPKAGTKPGLLLLLLHRCSRRRRRHTPSCCHCCLLVF